MLDRFFVDILDMKLQSTRAQFVIFPANFFSWNACYAIDWSYSQAEKCRLNLKAGKE